MNIKSALITPNYIIINGNWNWKKCTNMLIKFKYHLVRFFFHDQPSDFIIDSLNIENNKITQNGKVHCMLCHTESTVTKPGIVTNCNSSCPNHNIVEVLNNNYYLTIKGDHVKVSNGLFKTPSQKFYLDEGLKSLSSVDVINNKSQEKAEN